jgi:hypothetical protein
MPNNGRGAKQGKLESTICHSSYNHENDSKFPYVFQKIENDT